MSGGQDPSQAVSPAMIGGHGTRLHCSVGALGTDLLLCFDRGCLGGGSRNLGLCRRTGRVMEQWGGWRGKGRGRRQQRVVEGGAKRTLSGAPIRREMASNKAVHPQLPHAVRCQVGWWVYIYPDPVWNTPVWGMGRLISTKLDFAPSTVGANPYLPDPTSPCAGGSDRGQGSGGRPRWPLRQLTSDATPPRGGRRVRSRAKAVGSREGVMEGTGSEKGSHARSVSCTPSSTPRAPASPLWGWIRDH